MKLVCDDLITTTDEKNIEHYEILLDVQSACKTAVEILNDFLCFDKLESGILEIHKLEVSVIPFITNCVSMFSSQAKEAGVDISYITSTPNTTPFLNNNRSDLSLMELGLGQGQLLESDKVMIDKFKMDQVLRNLVSNALKFTPRGGSVTVTASFIPDDERDVLQCSTSIKDDWYKDKGSPKGLPSHAFSFPFKFIFPYPCGGSPRIFVSTSTETNIEAPKNNAISLRSAPDDASHDDFVSPMIVTSTRYSLKNPYPSSMFEDNNPANGWNSSGESIKIKLPALDSRKVRHIWSHHVKNDTICNPGLGPSDGMHKAVTGKLRLSVTDSGCGISNANQVRLFKEIVQFNPELLQAGGGSGLGLWITSSIVQMHGGTIEVYSAGTGKGSTFTMEIDMHRWVNRGPSPDPSPSTSPRPHHNTNNSDSERQLPLCASNITARLHDSLGSGSAQLSSSQGSRHDEDCPPTVVEPKGILAENAMEKSECNFERSVTAVSSIHDSLKQEVVYDVLIVDDSALNRKLLSKVLHGSGLLCEEAADGLCAIAKVKSKMASKSGNYDVILMDFVMPNMDGPAATRAIRTLGYSGPILGLTGNASSSDTEYFRDHGANAVLAKPFDLLTFKQLLSLTEESIITQVVATSSI